VSSGREVGESTDLGQTLDLMAANTNHVRGISED